MPDCTIVVANRYEDIWQDFVEGLKKVPAGVGYDIIRIDGSQKDFTYAKAMNEGLRQVKTPFVCFMNDDAHPLTKDWLRDLIIPVSECGFMAVCPIEILKNNFDVCRGLPPLLIVKSVLKKPGTTSTLNGFCLLSATDIINKIGGWDESFTHFYEDNDLSIRLEEIGWLAYVTYVHVEHKHKQSTLRDKERGTEDMIAQSKKRFLEKWGKTHSHLARFIQLKR